MIQHFIRNCSMLECAHKIDPAIHQKKFVQKLSKAHKIDPLVNWFVVTTQPIPFSDLHQVNFPPRKNMETFFSRMRPESSQDIALRIYLLTSSRTTRELKQNDPWITFGSPPSNPPLLHCLTFGSKLILITTP